MTNSLVNLSSMKSLIPLSRKCFPTPPFSARYISLYLLQVDSNFLFYLLLNPQEVDLPYLISLHFKQIPYFK